MMPWSRHLGDARLHECYFSERGGETIDPLAADHLAECSRCATRFKDLAFFMDGLRAEADAETDAVFTAERLQLQQQQIARRLDLLGHAARVISFPSRLSGEPPQPGRVGRAATVAPRWLVASAAAGLFVGTLVGSVYDFGVRTPPRTASPVASARPAAPQPPVSTPPPASLARPASVSSDDEAFLSQIELALGGPRTRELQPFDAMTPRVQEISTRLR